MQYLILGMFLVNTGITVALVSIFRYESQRRLEVLRDEQYEILFDLARKQGRLVADVEILRSQNATR
jgi:hypothetical protein